MRLTFRPVETLPRLAWCAKMTRGTGEVEVCHGPWVETGDDYFFEGAWSGEFGKRDFDTKHSMGSGGRIVGGRLLVATPSHTLERIFVVKSNGTLGISNSLSFLLASTGDTVRRDALEYSVILSSITLGVRRYARWLRTCRHDVRLYYHCNLLIDSGLRIVEQPKIPVREFANYADYKSFLLDEIAAIHSNANDSRRRITYLPITTISSGYDSPAAAVLAKSVGCTEALTFSHARGDQESVEDSGARIGSTLGMRTHVFDRLAYLHENNLPEIEFLGWGALESAWAPYLERHVLFTGFHGDKVWDRNCETPSRDIVRGDPSGHNLGEFRLRVGWIHLPVPFVGGTSHPSIHRVSNSPEMEPWSLKNGYDRPVPRRLVEEAGIARSEFGTTKKAAGVVLSAGGLETWMTTAAYHDFMGYCGERSTVLGGAARRRLERLRVVCLRHYTANKRIEKFAKNLGVAIELPLLVPRDVRIGAGGDVDALALLVPWSVEKLMSRYAVGVSLAADREPLHSVCTAISRPAKRGARIMKRTLRASRAVRFADQEEPMTRRQKHRFAQNVLLILLLSVSISILCRLVVPQEVLAAPVDQSQVATEVKSSPTDVTVLTSAQRMTEEVCGRVGPVCSAAKYIYQGLSGQIPRNADNRLYWVYVLIALVIAVQIYAWSLPDRRHFSLWGYLRFVFPKSVYTHVSSITDYKYFFASPFIDPLFRPLVGTVIAAVTTFHFSSRVAQASTTVLGPSVHAHDAGPGWAVRLTYMVLLLFFADLGYFIFHYLSHRVEFLWEFHKVHHAAEVLTPITGYRNHPVDNLVQYLTTGAVCSVLNGAMVYWYQRPPDVFMILGTSVTTFLYHFTANFRHSHIWLSYGNRLSHVLSSPAQHQIHHSCETRHLDKNFGLVLSVWDWMAGTLYVPLTKEEFRMGLRREEHREYRTLWGCYALPFIKAFRGLVRRLPIATAGTPRPSAENPSVQLTPDTSRNG